MVSFRAHLGHSTRSWRQSYFAEQRTREIGVRVALGATSVSIVALVMRRGAKLLAAGLVLGLVAAAALGRTVASLLYAVSPTDTVTYAAVAAVVGAFELAACYLPARRAAAVDPLVALRE
jgi:putative ABC transport system permease protein